MKAAFKKAILLPFTIWLLIYLVSFVFGYAPYPDFLELSSVSTPEIILALFFGLWIGTESFGNYGLPKTLGYAIMVSFIIGFAEVLIAVVLISTSQTFLYFSTYLYTEGMVVAPIVSIDFGRWLGIILFTVAGTGVGYTFMSKIKTR